MTITCSGPSVCDISIHVCGGRGEWVGAAGSHSRCLLMVDLVPLGSSGEEHGSGRGVSPPRAGCHGDTTCIPVFVALHKH